MARLVVVAALLVAWATVGALALRLNALNGATTVSASPNSNYMVSKVYYGFTYEAGTGSTPRMAAYYIFDFSGITNHQRMCIGGTPGFYVNSAHWGLPQCKAPPSGITVQGVSAASFYMDTITWNNQPALSNYLSQQVIPSYTALDDYWYVLQMSPDTLNKAVHQASSYSRVVLRTFFSPNTLTCYESYISPYGRNGYRPYLDFVYAICHQYASCTTAGTCQCNPGYTGDGVTSCTLVTCAATTLGNANFPSTTGGNTVPGTCQSTYGGSASATCTMAGTWSLISSCYKLTCAAQTSGSATYPLTNAGTIATGTCLTGYGASPAPTRACSATGTWGAVSASCTRLKCPATTIGTASFPQTDSMTNSVLGTCASGYSGSPRADCSASGTWGAVTGTCVRNTCTGYSSHPITWPTTNSLTTATGTCASGYTGAPQQACSAAGTWSGSVVGQCIRIQCPSVSNDFNADWPTTDSGVIATGMCVSGYSGVPQRPCSSTGTWGALIQGCTRNTCGAASDGNANWPAGTLSNTLANGVCHSGYAGQPSRVCMANGQWSSTINNPCIQLFCPAGTFDNAAWTVTAANTNDVAGSCVSGYYGTAKRNCLPSGEWGAVTTACQRVKCPANANDGAASWPETNSFDTVSGTCLPGWVGSPSRTCAANGEFGPIINPCIRKTCPADTVGRASWPVTNSESTDVVGTCQDGWQGAPTRSCDINGQWSDVVGECLQVFCDPIDDEDASATWDLVAAGSMQVGGTCYSGYYGNPQRDCLFNGTWSEVRNPCTREPCPTLLNDNNANWLKPAAVNTLVTGTCVDGYVKDPAKPPKRMCQSDSTWGPVTENPCIPINCTQTSGFLAFSATWPEVVQAGTKNIPGTCWPGYQGSPRRDCTLTGQWTSPSPSCEQIKCPEIVDDGNNMHWRETGANSTANGECLIGYNGNPTRVCSIDGQWGPVSNPCTRNRCPSVTFANALWPETVAESFASGSCQPGHVGSTEYGIVAYCTIHGAWNVSSVVGECLPLKCPETFENNTLWAVTNAGSTATGVCDNGYGSGATPTTRPCTLDGTWGTVSGECKRLRCQAATFDNAQWPEVESLTENVRGTCVAGWQGSPERDCLGTGLYSSVRNSCSRITCPETTDETTGATWNVANAGSSGVTGACPAGTRGSPIRACWINGTWGPVSGTCEDVTCPSNLAGEIMWPTTPAGETVPATCPPGYAGSPSRTCQIDGTWSPVANPCVRLMCVAIEEADALWPTTPSLTDEVEGTCNPTYFGAPKRKCDEDGNWGPIEDPCEPIYCPALASNGNAAWNSTRAGSIAAGTCISGYVGTPSRQCQLNGLWNTTIVNPCQPYIPPCPASRVGNTYFPSALPGTNMTGTCDTDFEPSELGPPTRQCFANGTWEEGFSNPCKLIELPNSGAIENLRVVAKTSTSVELSWSAINATNTTLFRVMVSYSTSDFQIATLAANSLPADNLKNSTVRLGGLAPYTVCNFRVLVGHERGYNEESAAYIAVRTDISPPGAISVDEATANSLTISWTPSLLAEFYQVFTRKVSKVRADTNLTAGYDLMAEVPSSAARVTIGDLDEGTTYDLLVLAGRDNETESTGARYRTATKSTTENIIIDPGLGDNGNIIAGASAGAVILFLILLVITIVLIRRRQRRTKELMDEFGGAEVINTLRSYRDTLSRSRNSMSHADSTTFLADADKTIVNTVMEVALPGFLQMDFQQQLRTTEQLSSGGAGIIFKATVVDPEVVRRIGTEEVVVKEVIDNPSFTEEQNNEYFHQEVSLMWSLSFHPNVIALVGYTDSPRTIITRLYATDLYRYLHNSENSSVPLDSALMLHLGAGISSGLNAIHSMEIAHRDMKAPNILLQAPQPGEMYPNAVICDFGLARTSIDNSVRSSHVVKGFSPRYAAPEVFVRARIPGAQSTLEEDKAADVFALGVIIWELSTRQVPWGDLSNDEIEMRVRAGQLLEVPIPSDDDTIRIAFAGIMQACMHPQADRRPLIAVVNNKIGSMLSY